MTVLQRQTESAKEQKTGSSASHQEASQAPALLLEIERLKEKMETLREK